MANHVNQNFFSVWTTDVAYVLGFWYADGWMTQPRFDASVCFTSKDKDHLELVRSLMQSEHKIHTHGEGCFRLPIGSKQLWNDLYALGGRPAKSLVAEMPYVPQEYMRHFVRGFVDGDGSLYWETSARRRPGITIYGGKVFLESLALLIDEYAGLGIATLRAYSTGKIPCITYTGIKAKTLAKWLYSNTSVALERKAILAQEFNTWGLSKFGWKSQTCMTPKMQEILVL